MAVVTGLVEFCSMHEIGIKTFLFELDTCVSIDNEQ